MERQIATTQDQSQRLLRCGVSADRADMCLSTRTRRYDGTFIAKKHQTTNLWIGYPCRRTTSGDEELENIPAWSLGRLLGLLPKEIKRDSLGRPYVLHIIREEDRTIAAYRRDWDSITGADKRTSEFIDSLYELLLWAIDHNHVKLD